MKTNTKIKIPLGRKILSAITIATFTTGLLPLNLNTTNASSNLVYPLKKISKLECRFNEFDTLSSDCLEDLPILRTSDYTKYATQNGWYNKFTRLYTVLWWASYKYWWDVWYGWHMWIDIATAKWTPVYSIADWEVINAKFWNAEWNFVSIKHNINWKTIVSNYMHLSSYSVRAWQRVSAWEEIWKVWSTWNSTWNHLHLQIDTVVWSSPAYYNYKTCPYSYYQITENWVCFSELGKITVDPLLFLETNWWVLNNISTHTTTKVTTPSKTTTSNTSSNKITTTVSSSSSIFDRNVFIGSSYADVREVQTIYKSLGYYKWEITWDYNDVLESVIAYQLAKWIISKRWDAWTWNFWPKTRTQTKADYNAYLAAGWKKAVTIITSNSTSGNNSEETTNDLTLAEDSRVSGGSSVKISRDKLMTREELEAKEVNDFLKDYKIDLQFENASWNVNIWETQTLFLSITNSRWKYFKWTMPWAMTFEVDNAKLSVFPESLYYFTDGKREIKITWLKEWNTTLKIKVWNVVVKTFNIWVFNWKKSITPNSAQIIWQTSYIWNTQSGLALLKSNWTNLINTKFSWTYTLKASNGNLVCLERWTLANIKQAYGSINCEEFKNEVTFTYDDTFSWLVVFEYKTLNKNASFEIYANWKKIWTTTVAVSEPNWLDKNYTYSEDVLNALKSWIASTWMVRWYFMQEQSLNEYDAVSWIKNALSSITSSSASTKQDIDYRLNEVNQLLKTASKTKKLSRVDLLNLVSQYLIFDVNNATSITYKDLNSQQNTLANSVFNKNETWKEQTWKNYFQPNLEITRWEWAYLIMKTLKNWNKNTVTLK